MSDSKDPILKVIDEKIEQVKKPSNIDEYAKDYAVSKLRDLKEELEDNRDAD